MNKYAHLSQPRATLDFHGKGIVLPEDACETARNFVEECRQKGFRKILIIVGKGMHSKNGAVLGPVLRNFLPTVSGVRSVITARRDRGGEGALEIEL